MKQAITKFLLPIGILLAISSMLTACNTAKGFGEDMQKGGEAISKSADESKDNTQ